MKLSTPVIDIPNKVGISLKDKILILGSCFADNIGNRMRNYGFDVLVNPFGTLYNPHSIISCVRRLVERKSFTEDDCIEMGSGAGKVCSFYHHTSFARESAEDFLKNANNAFDNALDFFSDCNKVIITLGTSWYFWHQDSNMIVSNCLKRPGYEFLRKRMSLKDVSSCLSQIIALCRESDINVHEKELIFTVSPIRHLADGAHGNQISKATLQLGVEETLSGTPGTDYFPSYEIMMDELRDYRFYAEDMCHPTKQAEDYIFERFVDWAMPKSELQQLEENIKKYKRSQHRQLI